MDMSVLILGEIEQKAIAKAVSLARDQALPWPVAKDIAIDDRDKPTTTLTFEERQKFVGPLPRSQHLLLGSYHCAISFEEQPAGLCRHLSVSVAANPAKLPNAFAMQMLALEFGFNEFPPVTKGRVWKEEFEPGHYAINIVEVVS
jgi:hypothetical protein